MKTRFVVVSCPYVEKPDYRYNHREFDTLKEAREYAKLIIDLGAMCAWVEHVSVDLI
jgi:hypothetical protein